MAKKDKILIDTSIQIGKFKYSEIQDYINSCAATAQVYSSFYVLFEFKVGLIQSFIDYWNLVNIQTTTARAMFKWSEKWGQREPKNFIIMHGIMMEKFNPIPSEKKRYLRKIEFVIFHLLTNFSNGIGKYLQGSFRYDDVVRFDVHSREDFPKFLELCASKNDMANQIPFWEKHKKELDSFLSSPDLAREYTSIHQALERIRNDISYANRIKTNKVIGDAVIVADVATDSKIISTDNSFTILGSILSKEVEIVPNTY